jgi:uncharacterized protein YdhG (YjbR/CyaY superfamily)
MSAALGAGSVQSAGAWARLGAGKRGAVTTPAKPRTIDAYLAPLPHDQRATLEKLRRTIRTIVPQAEECISYGLAAFRLDGQLLVGFGASAKHCGFYPMSGSTVAAFRDELAGYETSQGTIRFRPDHPLPQSLVRKLVKARIAENAARRKKVK